jgi:DNA-binding GntR family transcriptional regulator
MRCTVELDPYELLDEIDEDHLVKHIRALGYVVEKVKRDRTTSAQDAARDVYDELLRRRPERAREAMRTLLRALVPIEIMDAHDALQAGDVSTAICRLDSFIVPYPPIEVLAKRLKELGV